MLEKPLPSTIRGSRGFTLIELLIATSIFVMVASLSSAAFLAATKSSRKLQSTRLVQQAAQFAFEIISREVRQAKGVACVIGDAADCQPSAIGDPRLKTNQLKICTQEGKEKFFRLVDSNGNGSYDELTVGDDTGLTKPLTPAGIVVSPAASFSNKVFRVLVSHADPGQVCNGSAHIKPIFNQPFVELSAELANFDPATSPPPEKQAKMTVQTMVSLRNFVKDYSP